MRLTWSLVLALQFARAEKSEASRVLNQVEDLPPELREAITRGRWRSRRWRGTLRGDARGIIVPQTPPQEIARHASCRHHR